LKKKIDIYKYKSFLIYSLFIYWIF
jgi:hypothetical protein